MKNNFLITIIFLTFLAGGCITLGHKKDKLNKNIKIYKVDLNNDLAEETVEVNDGSKEAKDTVISIIKPDKSRIDSLIIPGRFTKIELIDLNEDGYKQLAVFYESKDKGSNLDIYNLKKDRLAKIFSAESKCAIETDFTSVLARIKVGRVQEGQDCSKDYPQEWQVWIWSGDKFIKEKE